MDGDGDDDGDMYGVIVHIVRGEGDPFGGVGVRLDESWQIQ